MLTSSRFYIHSSYKHYLNHHSDFPRDFSLPPYASHIVYIWIFNSLSPPLSWKSETHISDCSEQYKLTMLRSLVLQTLEQRSCTGASRLVTGRSCRILSGLQFLICSPILESVVQLQKLWKLCGKFKQRLFVPLREKELYGSTMKEDRRCTRREHFN